MPIKNGNGLLNSMHYIPVSAKQTPIYLKLRNTILQIKCTRITIVSF